MSIIWRDPTKNTSRNWGKVLWRYWIWISLKSIWGPMKSPGCFVGSQRFLATMSWKFVSSHRICQRSRGPTSRDLFENLRQRLYPSFSFFQPVIMRLGGELMDLQLYSFYFGIPPLKLFETVAKIWIFFFLIGTGKQDSRLINYWILSRMRLFTYKLG